MERDISTSDLVAALQVPTAEIAKWRKQGMPAEKQKNKYFYNEDEVYKWLIDTKKYTDGSKVAAKDFPILATRKEVAIYFDVTVRTVAGWLEDPTFPGHPSKRKFEHPDGHFPTREIAEWLIKNGKKATIPPELLDEFAEEHISYRLTHQDRLMGARADKAELERDRMLSSLLDAEAVYRENLRQHNAVITVLRSLPSRVAAQLPADLDESVKRTIHQMVEATVNDCREQVRGLIEGDEDDTAATKATYRK